MEYLAYRLKKRVPSIFAMIERVARVVVTLRFGRCITAAEKRSLVEGVINDRPAQMRALHPSDLADIKDFFDDLPKDWLKYFNPHSFGAAGLSSVLKQRAFLKYGLFVDGLSLIHI